MYMLLVLHFLTALLFSFFFSNKHTGNIITLKLIFVCYK